METASLSCFSEPMLNNRLNFHINGRLPRILPVEIITASSNAVANMASGMEGVKHAGSYPNAILHMLSNANLWSMSWKSRTVVFVADAVASIGNKRSFSSVVTTCSTKFRRDLVLNS
ncbi:hypothetical protein HanRHA438_Chr04g0181161 [Helianthus annuus]|nr:hypothetical protein HanRHA438_Chr04g0181161 [Helianthus annuus]